MNFLVTVLFAAACLSTTAITLCSAMDAEGFERIMAKSPRNLKTKIVTMDKQDALADRRLQFETAGARCYSTNDDKKPNRYCTFENTPREGAFLMLSCPDTKGDDLSKCGCTIGVGKSEDAPNTDTCDECGFCTDGTLAYNCKNVAEGTCIGRNCLGECISSLDTEEDLMLELIRSGSGARYISFAATLSALVMLFSL